MARQTIYLGACPMSEVCAKYAHYEQKQKELGAWMSQLRREFGMEPIGARLVIREHVGEPVLALDYDDDYSDAESYAMRVEARVPDYWDKPARIELGLSVGNGRH